MVKMVKMVRDATSCLRATITPQLQTGSRKPAAESLQPKAGRIKPEVESSHESQEDLDSFALMTWG
jgi:hypothetical protein